MVGGGTRSRLRPSAAAATALATEAAAAAAANTSNKPCLAAVKATTTASTSTTSEALEINAAVTFKCRMLAAAASAHIFCIINGTILNRRPLSPDDPKKHNLIKISQILLCPPGPRQPSKHGFGHEIIDCVVCIVSRRALNVDLVMKSSISLCTLSAGNPRKQRGCPIEKARNSAAKNRKIIVEFV